MHWDVDGRSQKVMKEIAAAVKNADKLILATDPDREGEAISWHILRILEERKALKKGRSGRAGDLQRRHQAVRSRCVQGATRNRRPAGGGLSGPPGAGLPRRLHALAGAVAQAARRPLGRTRPVGGTPAGVRPRGRDRGLQDRRVLDHRGHPGDRQGRGVPRPPLCHRRHGPEEARPQGRGLCHRDQGRHRERRLPRRPRREEGGEAQSLRALRHLDLADGRLAQARLLGQADHAARPAPVRGRRHRRRDRGSHHLHADRRRHHHSGGDQLHPRLDRA